MSDATSGDAITEPDSFVRQSRRIAAGRRATAPSASFVAWALPPVSEPGGRRLRS